MGAAIKMEPGSRVVWGGGKAHIVARPHGKGTWCGRWLDAGADPAQEGESLCVRCEERQRKDEARRTVFREQLAASESVAEENRKGRFVVYRCKLCGAQHRGSGNGIPWCFSAAHEAELERLEVQGPAFEGASG